MMSPFTVTQELASTVGAGVALLEAFAVLKFEPTTVTRLPPVSPPPWLAVFTALLIWGFAVAASKFMGKMVKPD